MVVIRLSRAGSKKRPFYRMVVTDSRKRRDSGYIERIGYYNPLARGQDVPLLIDLARVAEWQTNGAQLSDRVQQLIKHYKKTQAA